jgi:energy-coupling factor transporter ATP-binding protein EcfA2
MLEVNNLSVTYRDSSEPIISDLSFTLKKCEALWLKGSNGSGKTTLLLSLCNIIPQEIPASRTGDITLNNIRIDDQPLNKLIPILSIALSNPDWELFFSNPLDELVFALENIGLNHEVIKARIESVCSAFELHDKLDLASHQLSEGWKKLTALAVHSAICPQILLLDEPFNGLSKNGVRRVIEWLKSYLAQGGILIIAEHNDAVFELNPSCLTMDR